MAEEAEGLGEAASTGRASPGLRKERGLWAPRAMGGLPALAPGCCLGTQRLQKEMVSWAPKGRRILSTEGPGLIKAAHSPCDMETDSCQVSRDPEGLASESASSEHSGLREPFFADIM